MPSKGWFVPATTKLPRRRVVAASVLGGYYEASGWVEIRERKPDLRWWEARCKVLGWDHNELRGTMPIPVVLNLAGGGQLTGTAYVDQADHWGWKADEADLKMHGTEFGLKLREPRIRS